MEGRASHWAFLGVVLAQIVIFVVSLPGFGIETRKASDYSAWAGPVFLLLTILVFALGVATFVTFRSRLHLARELGAGQAIVALATNLLDISHVGGPAPPSGPLVLGIFSILVALVTLLVAAMFVRRRVEPPNPPPT